MKNYYIGQSPVLLQNVLPTTILHLVTFFCIIFLLHSYFGSFMKPKTHMQVQQEEPCWAGLLIHYILQGK